MKFLWKGKQKERPTMFQFESGVSRSMDERHHASLWSYVANLKRDKIKRDHLIKAEGLFNLILAHDF